PSLLPRPSPHPSVALRRPQVDAAPRACEVSHRRGARPVQSSGATRSRPDPAMLIPVILSGGSGTRLWPVSREAFPKPFMKLGGERSLLQRTLERSLPLADGQLAAIVTNSEYFFKTREEIDTLPAARGKRIVQLLEPVGRNTAPAIAMAALWAQSIDPDATLL